MRSLTRILIVTAIMLAMTTAAWSAATNWRIRAQADDGSDGQQGTAMHIGVYPTSSDGVDTVEPIQDQVPVYGMDMSQATRWIVGHISGDTRTWSRLIHSSSSPANYSGNTKQWMLRVAALPNSSNDPIRLRFYTLGSSYLPPATLGGLQVTYQIVMVNNRGVAGAPANGTTWTVPTPTSDSAAAFYTLPATLPMLKLSQGTHEAMANEGYVLAFQQKVNPDVIVDPDPPATLTVTITTPTSQPTYATSSPTVTLTGTASLGTTSVSWSNDLGGSGLCTGTTSWSTGAISLSLGQNTITVTARNAANETATDSLIVTYTESEAPISNATWKGLAMVSIPIIPQSSDPKQVIGFQQDKWFCYLPQQRNYAGYGNDPDHHTWFEPVNTAPGRGFWARFATEVPVPTGALPPQNQPARIRLYPGWNIVGQPFLEAVKWDTLAIMVQEDDTAPRSLMEANEVAANYMWGWYQNPGNPYTGNYYLIYDSSIRPGYVDELTPWRAFWMLAYKECDLIIPPPVAD